MFDMKCVIKMKSVIPGINVFLHI
uniref:Uncharacterized protein n=1 Tax=Anguilla anguilla TaxID=7936 RepID=A0A0E9XSR3_ANGAN